jgi:hypothetical protein
MTETYLSHEKITTEVYAMRCGSLYRQATKYECQKVPKNDVTETSEHMSARQDWALENIVCVGTQGIRRCRGNVKVRKLEIVSELPYQELSVCSCAASLTQGRIL